MASPQLENGHTRIAHEILEALSISNLSTYELRFILIILRLTYGFNRKTVNVKSIFLSIKTKTSPDIVLKTISDLKDKNIIDYIRKDNGSVDITFKKDYERWEAYS